MEKLTRLTTSESSGEQVLDGVYRVVVDLHVTADKNITLSELERRIMEAGRIDDIFVEKYAAAPESPFNVGDTIVLTAEVHCIKSVYLDTMGNLIISDKPVTSVVKVGEFNITLPEGLVAEVNNKIAGVNTEILFTGESVEIADLNRVAYLGILEIPSHLIMKAGT